MGNLVKQKILFVMSSFTIGGAEKQWAQYLSAKPRNVAVDLEIIVFFPSSSASVEKSFKDLGVKVTLIERAKLPFHKFLWQLYTHMRTSKPTLVHTVMTGSMGTWGRLAAFLAGVPHIIHSDRSLHPDDTRIQLALRPFLDRFTHRFLPNAHATADWLVSRGIPRRKITVMPNVTNVEKFNPCKVKSVRATWAIPETATVAGYIAKFRPEKRIDLLLDAVLLVPENERPDYLVMGGDGPMMPKVKARVEADPWLSKHCRLLGIVEDTPSFLASIDYTLLTSDNEGSPNVVLEAMAMEKPVVATKVSDVPRILEGAGILAEIGNAKSIAEGIRKMQRLSKEERAKLGKRGREKILETFELSKAAKVFWDAHLDFLGQDLQPQQVVSTN
jgi:glycosyltransferase involved in cell wall biosynthesis